MDQCFKVIKKTVEDKSALCYVSTTQIPVWKRYIEFVEDFCEVYGFKGEENLIALNVKKSAVVPLLHYKKDSEVYINTCRQIAATLRDKKSVTNKAVISFMGMTPEAPPLKKTIDAPPIPRMVMTNNKKTDLTARNQGLLNSLETPIISGLRKIMERDGLDTEYAALARAVANEVKRGKK